MEAEQPPSRHNDDVQEMVSHIGGVVKDTYAIGLNSDKFEQVANAFIDAGITTDQVDAFPTWWADNRHYEGRPVLKSLLDNIKEAAVPVEAASTFGTDFKVYNDPQT